MSKFLTNPTSLNLHAVGAELLLNFKVWEIYNKPQMNADERRFVAITHRKGRKERKAPQQNSLHLGVKKTRHYINSELVRTDTNSGYSEFVRVRFSSLLIYLLFLFTVFYERNSWLALRLMGINGIAAQEAAQ